MSRYLSPLRYPGGKARLAPFIRRLMAAQDRTYVRYAEPFAGGAGAALDLLRSRDVEYVHLNDLNPGIAAFWRAILDTPSEFMARICNTPVTVDEWLLQREIYRSDESQSDLDRGFATFFLNRTNRSGILNARPIGGMDQSGTWKIDARFNRVELAERVQVIAELRDRIYVSELDGLDFLNSLEHLSSETFVYADPPYLVQGDGLYLHAFDADAHVELAESLSHAKFDWMLTYDDDPRITERLYSDQRCAVFDIAHTAHRQHVGSEAIIFSRELHLPDLLVTRKSVGQWV